GENDEAISGPVDAEAELAALAPTGVAVNFVHKRVIPSLLRRALSPQQVLNLVVDATMAMALKHGLDWTREREIKDVTSRINSGLHLIQKDYDPASGEVPNWLAEEFVDDWIKVLQASGQPQLLRNRGGWYVRNTPKRGKSADTTAEATHSTEKSPHNSPNEE